MEETDLKQIEAMMTRVVGVFAEDVQHKFDNLGEGHQTLLEKLNRVESRIDQVEVTLTKKIDAIVADLYSHRRDTEAHRAGYRVRED
jgi:archaellum component FlaC